MQKSCIDHLSLRGKYKMSGGDYIEIPLDEETYKLAEKCAKKLGLTVDEFVIKAIDEKYEKLKREK